MKYALLKDKIRMGIQFNGFTFDNIKLFCSIIKTSDKFNDQDIIEFYKINYTELINNKYTYSKNYTHQSMGLLGLSIYCNHFKFFEIIIQDLKTRSTKSEFEKLIQNELNGESLLDIALKGGNLEIIKYLYQEKGYTILNQFNESRAIHNSLVSDNRDQIILYLLDDLKFIPPTIYTGVYKYYFLNMLLLDFNIMKRLYDMNVPLLFNRIDFLERCGGFAQLPLSMSEEHTDKEYNQFFNLFKSLLFTISVSQKDLTFNVMFKKLNYLLDNYSFNQDDNSNNQQEINQEDFYNLSKSEIIKTNESNDREKGQIYSSYPTQNKGIIEKFFGFIASFFEPNTQPTIINKNQENEILNVKGTMPPLEPIKVNPTFDLKREVVRMFIYDFQKYCYGKHITIISNTIIADNFKIKYNE